MFFKEDIFGGKPHVFGGGHTERKLDIVNAYLQGYVHVFKNLPSAQTIYADPFAGTGYWQMPKEPPTTSALFPNLPAPDGQPIRLGSAMRALQVQPRFGEYRFADVNLGKVQMLKETAEKYRQTKEFRGRQIFVEHMEANEFIVRLCGDLSRPCRGWQRAVVFLDPYGLQVNWKSLELLGATEKVDLWCLFPMEGAIRQISHNIDRSDGHKERRLASCFGLSIGELKERFYASIPSVDGGEHKRRIIDIPLLEKFVRSRLADAFKGMVAKPFRIYKPGTDHHLFSLFYALANPSPKARKKAQEIVASVRKKIHDDDRSLWE